MPLTNSDLTKIAKLLDEKLEEKLQPIRKQLDNVPSRKEVNLMIDQKLEPVLEKISHLPTKEEFYSKMDQWMKAADTSELEKAAHKADHARIGRFLTQQSIQ